MELDEFLTLPLPERIKWLRLQAGSHDKFAKRLGTSRQQVISWEKGAEPKTYAAKLADVSGFPADAFSRRGSEQLVLETTLSLLRSLRARVEDVAEQTAQGLLAVQDGISRLEAQLPGEDGRDRKARPRHR